VPLFYRGEYIQTRQVAYSAPFVILVHSHLGFEWRATAAERLSYVLDGDDDAADAAPSAGGTSTRSRQIS
jgi:hypothetical protein